MDKPNVTMNWKTGDVANDRHLARYQRCLYELISELGTIEACLPILEKYNASLLDNYAVNLDFPSDFDQTILPKEIQ